MASRDSQLRSAEEPLPFDPRQALEHFSAIAERIPAAADAVELLERDLLPRSAAGAPYLVCGIVGPNNAGKSALFNALVGRDLSPSDPTGGATRRLVGAAHPELVDRLRRNPHLSGFHLHEPQSATGTLAEAREEPADPRDLVVVPETGLPPHLVLIDTPDFDSILAGNRAVSESLVSVADVVVVVVTRHSYQNRAVVEFFREWLQHGRPWLLVYNEAIDETVARHHAEKLIADVGSMPLAAYWAPHRLPVQQREEMLHVEPLRLADDIAGVTGACDDDLVGRPLRDAILDEAQAQEIKAIAFSAAVSRLRSLAERVVADLGAERERLDALDAHGRKLATETGTMIASRAMPAGPFVEAFRVVLDRRTNVFSRSWRALVRGVRVGLERVPRLLRGGGDARAAMEAKLDEIEQRMLAEHWPEFWEQLVRDLGSEARSDVRHGLPADVGGTLDDDLTRAPAEVRQQAAARLSAGSADLGSFQQACEKLIDDAIEERGFDLDIQAAADLATVAPLAFAAVVIFATTGVGVDIAAAGGGAVGTFLFEKYSHVLGSGITKAARRRWGEIRGEAIGAVLLETALPRTLACVEQREQSDRAIAETLARIAEAGR